jgi:hypothetical protein
LVRLWSTFLVEFATIWAGAQIVEMRKRTLTFQGEVVILPIAILSQTRAVGYEGGALGFDPIGIIFIACLGTKMWLR